jgi:hypothetical protein
MTPCSRRTWWATVLQPDTFVIKEGSASWVKLDDVLRSEPPQTPLSPTIYPSKAPSVPPPVQPTKKTGLATYQKVLIAVLVAIVLVGYFLPKETVVNSDGGVLGDGRKVVFSSLTEMREFVKRCLAMESDPVLWAFQNTYNHTPDDPYAQQYYKQIIENRSRQLVRQELLRAESNGGIFLVEPGTRVQILDSVGGEGGKADKIRIKSGPYTSREGWMAEDCLTQ